MSNYQVEPASKPQALTTEALKAIRHEQVAGRLAARAPPRIARRGDGPVAPRGHGRHRSASCGPTSRASSAARSGSARSTRSRSRTPRCPIDEGFPAYYPAARRSSCSSTRRQQRFIPGEDQTGDGTSVNVRALYQRCPHLGCKPNPCLKNFWMECPCHGSRYDRLGIKAAGPQYGPAPRSMDRFGVDGRPRRRPSIVNTGKITLGPLPIAVGQPGIIPPKTPTGCI